MTAIPRNILIRVLLALSVMALLAFVADRLYQQSIAERFAQQLPLDLRSASSRFNPLTQSLTLYNVDWQQPQWRIQADKVVLHFSEQNSVTRTHFVKAHVVLDPDFSGVSSLPQDQLWTFEESRLTAPTLPAPVNFQQLKWQNVDGELQVSAQFGSNALLRFQGAATTDTLDGVLDVQDVPLQFWPDPLVSAASKISGLVNASLTISWQANNPITAEGELAGTAGEWRNDELQFNWSSWQMQVGKTRVLSLDDFHLTTDVAGASRFAKALAQTQWFQQLNVRNGTVDAGSLQLSRAQVTAMQANGLQYEISGQLPGSGSLNASGQYTDMQHNYRFTVTDLLLPVVLPDLISLKHHSTHQETTMTVHKVTPPALKALSNRRGELIVPLTIQPIGDNVDEWLDHWRHTIALTIDQLINRPQQAVNSMLPRNVPKTLAFEPGTATLTATSKQRLKRLTQLLAKRSLLRSELALLPLTDKDKRELSSIQLEKVLTDLASANSKSTRAQLLEQMYLMAHKGQKIPDVGQSEQHRTVQAHTWLLDNWTLSSKSLTQLQQARLQTLKRAVSKQSSITVKASTVPNPSAVQATINVCLRNAVLCSSR